MCCSTNWPEGERISRINVGFTAEWHHFQVYHGNIEAPSGKRTVYLAFKARPEQQGGSPDDFGRWFAEVGDADDDTRGRPVTERRSTMTLGMVLTTVGAVVGVSAMAFAGSDGAGWSTAVPLEMREGQEWCAMRHMEARDDQLPRIMLVGDSIVLGHAYHLANALRGVANVSWLATSRCLGDPAFDNELQLMLHQYDYDIIYFNNGLHGRAFTSAQYELALAATFEMLAALDATVVWRDSTHVNPERPDAGLSAIIAERNQIARKHAAKHGMQADGLGTFVAGDFIDSVHFAESARVSQAEQIANRVKANLKDAKE